MLHRFTNAMEATMKTLILVVMVLLGNIVVATAETQEKSDSSGKHMGEVALPADLGDTYEQLVRALKSGNEDGIRGLAASNAVSVT